MNVKRHDQMKKVFDASVFLVAFLFISYACQQEESYEPSNGDVIFTFTQIASINGQSAPAYVVLTYTAGDGSLSQDVRLPISLVNNVFGSAPLELPAGNYQLQQFTAIDSDNKVIYAAPKKGSDKAGQVTLPLVIEFTVGQNTTIEVTAEVLEVSPEDTPADYGYSNFGVGGTNGSSEVLIKTNVKIEIGGVLYENVDAQISVSGYDSYNGLKWTKDYSFTGPDDNVLAIQSGFHHYSIELRDKWGIHDIQSDISAQAIWDGRADGPLPVTYVLAGSKNAKKLSSYVTSFEVDGPGGSTVFQPESRILYHYNTNDELESINHQSYNQQTLQFEEASLDVFTHEGAGVSHITTYLLGKLYSDYDYQYGIENKVTLTMHYNNELVLTQSSATNETNDHIIVSYSLSNGNAFKYEFDILLKNIVSDKTTQSSQICSEGNFSYDRNINPFRHLGYTDFDFQNWSANNKVTEDVHYMACGFPTLIPVSHSYTYDQDGYPLEKITTYKIGSFDGGNIPPETTRQQKIQFYYQ
jgi:hypothetical protein